jgi:hypothetical protein
MTTKRLSPKEFLKARRPERFSDSVGQDVPVLDRSQLEYHLDTLTNRSEELPFESFARRLLERTVCPNLLPHTGPTGGGDSKVDTETYPVAEGLSLGWYVGTGNASATERWAFAVSAKRVWRPKIESDIAKIVATNREYTKAFFVSNQFIRDKARAKAEDELRKKYKIDVRIFDRTWILDRVFSGRLENLAIEELGLKTSVRREVRKGPRDTEREQDLEAVEARIADMLQQGRHTPALVEESLLAAELACSLERPRTEVEGLAARAERLAKQYGTPHQFLESAYNRAWTTFWWYEDYAQFAEIYREVEERARDSRNAYDLELWANVYFLLHGAVQHGDLQAAKVDLKSRTTALTTALDRLSQEQERLSAALQARTIRLEMKLLLAKPESVDGVLRDLTSVVKSSESLVGYPLRPLVKILTELGDVIGNRRAYEELFEILVQTITRRDGEISAAQMLLTRGAQQLENEHPYEAIRNLGRALGLLYKHESRHDLVRALYLCARAYEQVGLLWAARGTLLFAASIASNEYWVYDKVTPQQAVCYNRLKWIELRLGRLPHLLAWHELDRAVRAALALRGYPMERIAEDDLNFDPILAMLFLRTGIGELRELTTLPDVLSTLGLSSAAVALLYALGHEKEVKELIDSSPEENPSKEALLELFRQWRDQPAAEELPPTVLLYTRRTVTLHSNVLGCEIVVDCANQSPCVELAESALAAIESFLATGVLERMVAHEPKITINVQPSDIAEEPFTFEVQQRDGQPHLELRCRSFLPHSLPAEQQQSLKRRLFEVVTQVLAHMFMFSDPEPILTQFFHNELAPQRAIDFTTSFVVVGNVLGHNPKTVLSAWTGGQVRTFSLNREQEWDVGDRNQARNQGTPKRPSLAPPEAMPPEELLNPNNTMHTQMKTLSLIRMSLWDEAEWVGTGFGRTLNGSLPPIIALMFSNAVPAAKIFALWRRELGQQDVASQLRVTIVRGISKKNPHAYRVVLGSNPLATIPTGITRFSAVSRLNTMNPSSGENLQQFLDEYRRQRRYILARMEAVGGQWGIVKEEHLVKDQLVVRDAWEIGPGDVDMVAIREDDDPIVPKEKKDAPVLKILERWRTQTKQG